MSSRWSCLRPAPLALALLWPALAAAQSPVTFHLSATDAGGAFVEDLAAPDVRVTAFGRPCVVRQLQPASGTPHVAVLVDDGGNGLMRSAVSRLASATAGRARISISILNPQPYRLNDFTADPGILAGAIGKVVERGRVGQGDPIQLIEAISWAAKDMQARELSRPAVVVFTNGGEPGWSEEARHVVEELRQSGAALHVVYVGGVPMGRVLIDGPTQSGGSSQLGNGTQAFEAAALRIADMLAHQFRVTCDLPAGARPNGRVEVTSSRARVRVVAPTRIPD